RSWSESLVNTRVILPLLLAAWIHSTALAADVRAEAAPAMAGGESPLATAGDEPATGGEPAPATIPGWNELIASLRALPERLLSKLPASMQQDPQVRQEVGRILLAALAASTL